MFAFAKRLILSAILLVGGSSRASAAPTAEEIARAIRELSDNQFAVREKASAFLQAAGQVAEPALQEAAKSPDIEVARRAKEILREFHWGIYPNTPKEILQAIRDYRGGNEAAKQTTIAALSKLGAVGYETLVKMASAEESYEGRTDLLQFLGRDVARTVPLLLLDGREDAAEQFLEALAVIDLENQKETATRHYAAWLLQRGRLDAKIALFPARAAKAKATDMARALCYLHRAKGDLPAARQAAEKADDPALAQLVLQEEGNWQELVKRLEVPKNEAELDVEALAYRAAFQRLAGQKAAFEKTIEELRKTAAPENSSTVQQVVKTLFLNDRPADALALLLAKKDDLAAFEILNAQLRYREALELANQAKPDADSPRHPLELRQAYLLHQLGEQEKAKEKWDRAAALVQQAGKADAYGDLIRAELRSGRTEQALDHAAQALAKLAEEYGSAPILGAVFPEHDTTAPPWWALFRKKHVGEKEAATLQRLRDLFGGKVTGKKLADLARELEQTAKADKTEQHAGFFMAIAEVHETAREWKEARVALQQWAEILDSTASWQRLGDFVAKHGRDAQETAALYDRAFRKDMSQPLPLFLRGQTLIKAGQKTEGRQLVELAHRIPLADEEIRYAFAVALIERGFPDDARQEYELILRVGPGEGWHTAETLRHLAYNAIARKNYSQAAERFERFRLTCLRTNTTFVEHSAYLHVPVAVHQNRARAALQAGKLEEAKQAMQQCLTALPGGVQLPIEMVAALDKAGRSKEGGEIFRRVFDLYAKQSMEYPRGASLHNSVAWLAATCRRELDKGLAHAEKAVALSPKEAGYLDTLAEVCFQRGDKDRAVKLMKRCRELEPDNAYFPRQLQRIEKGDPKAPLPEQE